MTVFISLDEPKPVPAHPSFLRGPPKNDPSAHVQKVVKALTKAKRIVVVCGAGISVQAGIPDFRSPDGLFQTLKRDNPKEVLTSGKDLFDASVFNNESTTSIFCQMIARLAELSEAASPTPFHQLMRALDDRGQLLRVYTQNIDCIEAKTGLSFGVPFFEERNRVKAKGKAKESATPDYAEPSASTAVTAPIMDENGASSSTATLIPPPSSPTALSSHTRLPSPPAEIPRCIPLHGTLQYLHCQTCMSGAFPLTAHIPYLQAGLPPPCPECTALEETRQLVGKRARGVGRLRPSVVLYNEAHWHHGHGEGVGHVAQQDLMGVKSGRKGRKGRSGADLLIVVGTSLRVPGTKRMVREFSKAVKVRGGVAATKESGDGVAGSSTLPAGPSTPTRGTAATPEDDIPIKTIYLNYDFPVPTRDWDGVFDVWIQGDAQSFAGLLQEEFERQEEAKRSAEVRRTEAAERKVRREAEAEKKEQERLKNEKGEKKEQERERLRREAEEAAAWLEENILTGHSDGASWKEKGKGRAQKRKNVDASLLTPPHTPKKRKVVLLVTDPGTPSKAKSHARTRPPTSKSPPKKTATMTPSISSNKPPHRLFIPEVYIPTAPSYYQSALTKGRSGSNHVPTSPLTPPSSCPSSPLSALTSPPLSPRTSEFTFRAVRERRASHST